MHKKRLTVFSTILKIGQILSFILIGFRFIITCDAKKSSKFKDDSDFSFIVESYIYLALKTFFLLLLSFHILKSLQHADFPASQRSPTILLLVIIGFALANQSLLLIYRLTPSSFRDSPSFYLSRFYLDLVLICALTIQVIVMKRMELRALVKMGVFKELDAMNDREMFAEYDKMLKQSTKVRVQYKDRLKAAKKDKEGAGGAET